MPTFVAPSFAKRLSSRSAALVGFLMLCFGGSVYAQSLGTMLKTNPLTSGASNYDQLTNELNNLPECRD